MKLRKLLVTVGLLLATIPSVFSENNVALKTNILYDALLTPTLGIEVGLAPKWSFDLSGSVNAWKINSGGKDRRWKIWMVQPEARYWFCQRFAGHFIGVHAHGGQYNWGQLNLPFTLPINSNFRNLKDHRFQGWFAGAGVAYGYSWILDKHWNFEAEIGIGWAYTRFDEFRCENCGKKIQEDKPHNYFGPTKAALNIIYVF